MAYIKRSSFSIMFSFCCIMKKKVMPNLTTKVSDLLNDWPQAIPVFVHRRMACVGCSMSGFETIGDAAKNYNISAEDLLNDVYQAIGEDQA